MKYAFFLFSFSLIVLSCKSDDDCTTACDQSTIISAQQFENAPDAPLNINNLTIEGDCLRVKFSASGCSGNTWVVKLIDKGVVLESNPPQRILRVSLLNNEACLAVFTQEYTFDITNLRVENTNEVLLNITNSDEQILYSYLVIPDFTDQNCG